MNYTVKAYNSRNSSHVLYIYHKYVLGWILAWFKAWRCSRCHCSYTCAMETGFL